MFTSTSSSSGAKESSSNAEYVAIGVSSALLALVYVTSVSLYLRQSHRKKAEHDEESGSETLPPVITGRCSEDSSPFKSNLLTMSGRDVGHFETDRCGYSTTSEHDLACKSKIDKNFQLAETKTDLEDNYDVLFNHNI